MNIDDDSIRRVKNVDPVDVDHLVAVWSASDAKSALYKEIISMSTSTLTRPDAPAQRSVELSATRHPRAWRRPLRLAVATAVIITLAAAATTMFSNETSTVYAVYETADGLIHVNVVNPTAGVGDGNALARDLRDRGIDTDVATVAASPSMVGHVELGSADGPADGIDVGGADGTAGVFDWTIDPSRFHGTLVVTIYVQGENGEAFGAAESIFEPGEKLGGLQCALGEPMRAADVERYLDQVGLTPIWSVVTPTDDPAITNSELVDTVPDGIVLSGFAVTDTTARFEVLRDGTTLGQPIGNISETPCTPDAASPWE
jgi:hypothetical protein